MLLLLYVCSLHGRRSKRKGEWGIRARENVKGTLAYTRALIPPLFSPWNVCHACYTLDAHC